MSKLGEGEPPVNQASESIRPISTTSENAWTLLHDLGSGGKTTHEQAEQTQAKALHESEGDRSPNLGMEDSN